MLSGRVSRLWRVCEPETRVRRERGLREGLIGTTHLPLLPSQNHPHPLHIHTLLSNSGESFLDESVDGFEVLGGNVSEVDGELVGFDSGGGVDVELWTVKGEETSAGEGSEGEEREGEKRTEVQKGSGISTNSLFRGAMGESVR